MISDNKREHNFLFGVACDDQSPCPRRGLGEGQICKCGQGPQGVPTSAIDAAFLTISMISDNKRESRLKARTPPKNNLISITALEWMSLSLYVIKMSVKLCVLMEIRLKSFHQPFPPMYYKDIIIIELFFILRGETAKSGGESPKCHGKIVFVEVEPPNLSISFYTPAAINHCLNSGTRAFEMIIFSGSSTVRLSERRLPNHTVISFTALRAMMN